MDEPESTPEERGGWVTAAVRWFDSSAEAEGRPGGQTGIDWIRVIPFLALHLACGAVLWVGWSPVAVAAAAGAYAVRMFAITGFYHRYFSHRTFRTSRFFQFLFALLGSTAVQRGPLWWAAHHRRHHRCADQEADPHSPVRKGFLWSHVLWILSRENFPTDERAVRDLAKYPELRFLNRFDALVPLLFAASLYGLGALLAHGRPSLGTNGPQMLVWGFVISTIVLFHATFTINSLAHQFGSRRYQTGDQSRNNLFLALLTFGEGWHNNHHRYPGAVRQGFAWWEIDLTFYGLKLMSWFGIIRDLHPVPAHVYGGIKEGRVQ